MKKIKITGGWAVLIFFLLALILIFLIKILFV
jgi:hypothetical protein